MFTLMTRRFASPYHADFRRLTDVIAALQAMGAYRKASLPIEEWKRRLKDPSSASDWKTVFSEHPEFFVVGEDPRTHGHYALLRWRHSNDRVFDPEAQRELSAIERGNLKPDELERLTAKPLAAEEIQTLLETAIELHVRAIAHAEEHRWLTPLLFTLLGAIIGALFGGQNG
jgi:hypothetical protein